MKKVIAPAIKSKAGKVTVARPRENHDDIPASGKRGFVLSDGAFAGRGAAAKVAAKAGQADVKKLHSSNLKGRK
jgi:hypothetical protein